MRARQILDRAWQWLGRNQRLIEILVAFLLIQILVVLLPQAPLANAMSPDYSRWLAEQRTILKNWTTPLSVLGLLNLRTSAWMRALLVWLTLIIAAHAGELLEQGAVLSPARRRLQIMAWVAGLLIVIGWSMQLLWGWKRAGVIVWPGEPITIPETELTLPPPYRSTALFTKQYGLYLIPKGNSVGLIVQALDQQGQALPLLPSARDEARTELRLMLTTETPDVYFALPEFGFIFRISRLRAPRALVQAQVYHSADGELLAETTLEGDKIFFVGDVRLQLDYHVLPLFEAVYNPGAIIEGAGMLLLGTAALGRYYVERQSAKQLAREEITDRTETITRPPD